MTGELNELEDRILDDRYKIVRCLGTGTMGAVYEAEHVLMKKRVALKVLHPSHTQDKEVVARFQREAQAAANIEHPNICAATDFGLYDDNLFYLVMEFLDGRPLADLATTGALPVERCIHIIGQILSALEKAHEIGVVHRDLKPENVLLVSKEGKPDFVKITDFGVAQVRIFKDTARLTQAGVVYGSPLYMSPQQAEGLPVDHRADLYSVGVILYELLTGKLPFYAKSLMVVLNMHVSDPPPPFSEVTDIRIPKRVEAIVMKLLAKDPDDRYQDARSVRLELESALEQPDKGARTDGANTPTRPMIWAGIGGAILAIGVGVAAYNSSNRTAEEEAPVAIEFEPEQVETTSDKRSAFLADIGKQGLEDVVRSQPEEILPQLAELTKTYPDSAHLHYLTGIALMETGNHPDAMQAFSKALERDSQYGTDPTLLDATFQVFEAKKLSDAKPAVDFVVSGLKDLASARLAALAEHHKRRTIRKRALGALRDASLFEKLPKWNQLTIELRHATGCENNRDVIVAMTELGDPRALAALRRFSAIPKNQCDGKDCYACAREDERLAIDILETNQSTRDID